MDIAFTRSAFSPVIAEADDRSSGIYDRDTGALISHWNDTSDQARPRWRMLLPWAAGFAVYQLVFPGAIHWWADLWGNGVLHGWWASASILSFAVSAALALLIGWPGRARS